MKTTKTKHGLLGIRGKFTLLYFVFILFFRIDTFAQCDDQALKNFKIELATAKTVTQLIKLEQKLQAWKFLPFCSRLESGKKEMLAAISKKKKGLNTKPQNENSQSRPAQKKSVLDQLKANMVYVSGGSFTMGCTSEQHGCSADERPSHQVTLNSFYIGKYEVTQEEWQEVMGSNPSNFSGCPKCPVESVSWNDCQLFLEKLNEITGKNFRLPTEAEWEFAARGGNEIKGGYEYAGSNILTEVGWFRDNNGSKTHPVGRKLPNELGLYDMSGNVWEWCNDWYSEDYYANSPSKNPAGPTTGPNRVRRGGGWDSTPAYCRVAFRGWFAPVARTDNLGFRLVLPSR
jgi:formylglycine-generating enzyme required for sulfatase activity